MPELCSICRRDTPDRYTERHHLIPHYKKGKETIPVCKDCGDQIHQLFDIHELRTQYNTLEALLADERIQKWIRWIRKKPNEFGSVCMKTLKRNK
jgi:hypothetical protein